MFMTQVKHEDISCEPLANYLRPPEKFQAIKTIENTPDKIMGSLRWDLMDILVQTYRY
jgi:hypothetical protein